MYTAPNLRLYQIMEQVVNIESWLLTAPFSEARKLILQNGYRKGALVSGLSRSEWLLDRRQCLLFRLHLTQYRGGERMIAFHTTGNQNYKRLKYLIEAPP